MKTCMIIFLCVTAFNAKAQSFAIGGGTTFEKHYPFFNVEGGIWNIRQTKWNAYAGLKARVIAIADESKESSPSNITDARFTPYLRLGYSIIPNDKRVFGELSLTLERSPELGAAFHWRIAEASNICITVLPRITMLRNDLTTGAYLQLSFGL